MATLTDEQENTNLICPLVSKLSTSIQAKILRSASETMEKGKWWNPSGMLLFLRVLNHFPKFGCLWSLAGGILGCIKLIAGSNLGFIFAKSY